MIEQWACDLGCDDGYQNFYKEFTKHYSQIKVFYDIFQVEKVKLKYKFLVSSFCYIVLTLLLMELKI